MSDKIVTVNLTVLPPPVIRYAVLRNKTAAEVEAYARAHPRIFVFPFATKTVDECPDYSSLAPPADGSTLPPSWRDYVVNPMYIGNFDDPEDVIQEFVKSWTTYVDTIGELIDDL
jgi:hypothetical protein